MMQLIRDKAQGIVSWVIVAIIAIVFCSWGVSGYMSQGPSSVLAKVKGEEITSRQVDDIYNRWLHYTSAQKGFKAEDLNPTLIKQQITKSLAEQLAVVNMLRFYGLAVSDAVLMDSIKNNPDFQEDNKFSAKRYKEYLANLNLSEPEYEQLRRNEILGSQAQHMVIDSSFALNSEVTNLIAIKNQKRSFEYLLIPAANYAADVKVSDADIDAYYAKSKSAFVIPEKIRLEYVELSIDNISSQTQVTAQQVRDYYEKNKQLFAVQDFDKIKKTVENSYKQEEAERLFASKGEELANLAFENPKTLAVASEKLKLPIKTTDYFGRNGGTGIVGSGDVLNAAFSNEVLDQQHNSDLIRISDDSYVVIRVKDRQAQKQQTLTEVRAQIIRRLQAIEAQAKAKAAGDKLLADLKQGKAAKKDWKALANVERDNKQVDFNLLQRIFTIPKPDAANAETTIGFKLPNGDYAVVALTKVTNGALQVTEDSDLPQIISQQVATLNGNMQYVFLQSSLIAQADIEYKR